MHIGKLLITTGLTLLLGTGSAWAYELQPFTASYKFNIDNKLSGKATRSLEKKADGSWLYSFSASAPMATASETSSFRFDGKTVTPLRYAQQRKIFMVKKGSSVDFDWSAKKGSGKRDGKQPVSYALQAGTVDSLNLEVQIRRDLKDLGKLGGPYWIASPKAIEQQPFVIEGEEVLTTPMGKLNTLKVSRKHNDPTRHTTFWLAKDYDFLPAKVTQDNDGALYIIELTSYKPAAAAAK
ncbi:MAG TPA: DUF3108 domain-containing protein [Moraxellaceae bacterium]